MPWFSDLSYASTVAQTWEGVWEWKKKKERSHLPTRSNRHRCRWELVLLSSQHSGDVWCCWCEAFKMAGFWKPLKTRRTYAQMPPVDQIIAALILCCCFIWATLFSWISSSFLCFVTCCLSSRQRTGTLWGIHLTLVNMGQIPVSSVPASLCNEPSAQPNCKSTHSTHPAPTSPWGCG